MRMSLSGLGDTADCGADPCTWWDDVYMRDPCLAYKACVDPTNFMVQAVNKGLIAATGASALDMAGTVVTAVGAQAGSAVGTTTGQTIKGLFTNPDGTTNWQSVGLVAAAGVVAMMILKGR